MFPHPDDYKNDLDKQVEEYNKKVEESEKRFIKILVIASVIAITLSYIWLLIEVNNAFTTIFPGP